MKFGGNKISAGAIGRRVFHGCDTRSFLNVFSMSGEAIVRTHGMKTKCDRPT